MLRAGFVNCVISVGLLAAATAQAQVPLARGAPPHAQAVEQLAEILGRSHYLQILCEGSDDQRWRTAMQRMLDIEAPRGPRRSDLVRRFNDGFRMGEEAFFSCSAIAADEARALAREWRRLSDAIAAQQRPQ